MTLYSKFYSELNNEQREALDSSGRCVVLAGPGSGKTHTLVLKTAYLLGEEVQPPQRLACITYHNDAVDEIETRLGKFGPYGSSRLFVGTVHSFCLAQIIRPFIGIYLHDSWYNNLHIAEDKVQQELYATALAKLDNPYPSLHLNEIHKYRLSAPLDYSVHGEDIDAVCRAYESELRLNNFIDFNDIAIAACRLVERYPLVAKMLSSRFPWIVVDEYQNLGYPFHHML